MKSTKANFFGTFGHHLSSYKKVLINTVQPNIKGIWQALTISDSKIRFISWVVQVPSGGKTSFRVLNGSHWFPLANSWQKVVPTGEGSIIDIKIYILNQFLSNPNWSRCLLLAKPVLEFSMVLTGTHLQTVDKKWFPQVRDQLFTLKYTYWISLIAIQGDPGALYQATLHHLVPMVPTCKRLTKNGSHRWWINYSP